MQITLGRSLYVAIKVNIVTFFVIALYHCEPSNPGNPV
ncbi:hypothetical protein J2X53_003476 [Pseudorhodobacter sp. 4114]|nr:hypothetical protein [Pseudorhodobacter sp. 4114]